MPVIIPVEQETTAVAPIDPMPAQSNGSRENTGSAVIIALAVIGTILALGAVGAGGFFLAKHFLGYNVTVYSIDGPREIVKAGKIKMDLNSPEPTITLDKVIGHNTAETDRYIIQIAQRAIPKLVDKELRVVLHDKEALHEVPQKALGMPMYEFEVNFSDDDEPDEAGGGWVVGYPLAGDDRDT